MARQTDEERKKSLKIKQQKRKGKQAYTPMSEKEKDAAMRRLVRGLQDGSIKAPLPADLNRGGGYYDDRFQKL